ncbi:hypothetical protein [Micromonospora sp. NPDC005174]|uniref:hypothetical protein n=1 Tax=Micromonospora sp. NPDC005174 TaxID=3157018 RepID=UPI0033AD6505
MTATSPPDLHVRLPVELLDLVAAGKLTVNAAYLYALLLTHINYQRGGAHVWPSRSNLAKRMSLKNARAVDRYIAELIGNGLVEKECRRNELRNVNDTNRYTLLLVSWPEKNSARGSAPQHTTPGMPEHTTLVSQSAHELEEPQLDQGELDRPCTEENRSPSTRFAPSGAGDFDSQPAAVDDQPSIPQQRGNWYLNDRDDFRATLGERIMSQGVKNWNRGTFPTNAVYDALRQRQENPIDRPGSYVASLLDKQGGDALDNWLLREGFSLPEQAG